MKRFEFRLDPLLKIRRMKEDEKQRVVGELMSDINAAQQKALDMAEDIRQQSDILKQQRSSGQVDLNWVTHYRRFVSHMQGLINQKIEEVRQIQKKLILARHELAEAAKETKILEKLKERRRERYEREAALQEMRELDEISTKQFIRNQRQQWQRDYDTAVNE